MYNVCTLTRFLTIHHCVFRPTTRQQIFTFNAHLRTALSVKTRATTVKAQLRWCRAEGLSKGNRLFRHCSSLSGNFVFHFRWFFENGLLVAQVLQIPHSALGKHPIEILVEVTPIRETADTHRPPHVLGTFATARIVHVDLCICFIFPPSVALPLMAAHSWCFHCDTWGTVTVLHLQLVLCSEPYRFVADWWCAFVRFSSAPVTRRASPLFTCL